MEKYDVQKYSSLLVKGNLHEAIKYLEMFPEHHELLKRYNDVFKLNQELSRSDNDVINKLDSIYQSYYKNVFWFNEDPTASETKLFDQLWEFCGGDDNIKKNKYIESEVEKIVRQERYEYLGGKTAGYYGPYIWKDSRRETYDVELPYGTENYSVIMMDGFVSRSWLDFLSFGKVGTGGWIGKDGTLCCVSSHYDTESLEFKVSFLKHEAQHGYDKRVFPNLTSEELEYRAKLVEQIYWEDKELLKRLHFEADNSENSNSHSLASHRIISDLSRRVFKVDYEENLGSFVEKLDYVKELAKILLDENSSRYSE